MEWQISGGEGEERDLVVKGPRPSEEEEIEADLEKDAGDDVVETENTVNSSHTQDQGQASPTR
jgi:hypothetical protein